MHNIAKEFEASQIAMMRAPVQPFKKLAEAFINFLTSLREILTALSDPNVVPRQQSFVQAALHLQNAIDVGKTSVQEATDEQVRTAFRNYVPNQFQKLENDFKNVQHGWRIVLSILDMCVQPHGFDAPVPYLILALEDGLASLAQICDEFLEYFMNMSLVTFFLNGIIPQLQNARNALVPLDSSA